MTTNLTGSPASFDMIEFIIVDSGTAKSIAWGVAFSSSTVTLPTTTVANTELRVLFQRNIAGTLWVCIAVA